MNYIYLDTNVFYGSDEKVQNYFVPPFSYLSMLSAYGFCKVILPEVAKIEEEAHIKKKIAEFINNKGLPFQLIDQYRGLRNEKKLRAQFFSLYEKFLKSTNSIFIPMNSINVDAAEMVSLRYTQQAPFTSKKDNEFQDILIATSLIEFFTQHPQDHFIVISNDKGFKKYLTSKYTIENLSFYDSLEDYTKSMLSILQEKHKDVIQMASNYISGLSESIELCIENYIESNALTINSCGDVIETFDESCIDAINPIVEMAEVIDGEVYAYVLCEISYWAKAEVLNEDKSEYDFSKHEYIKKVYDPIVIDKTWNVRLVIELFCECDENNNPLEITDFNDIEVADGLDFILYDEDIQFVE